ncbi:unnamed protein product [Oikopleura dioica]|nr:unnamed protein product [Oikopleura dioica]
MKDNRRLEKKNRALMEAQRVYELDKKEAEADLQAMSNKLENESRSKRQIEAQAKRKVEDERRKINFETSRKLREAEESSKNKLNLNEAKMHQLRDILSKNSPRTPTASRTPRTAATPVSSSRVTTDHLAHKRRSKSADKWLAHTPKETIDPGTVLQPKVLAKKNVHIPSVGDLRAVDQYLLTHQELGNGNQVKTTLVKGEVFGTRTGGTQVRFTGKEKLTSSSPSESRGVKRRSNEEPESLESASSAFTDIAARCDLAVVHEKGASSAHITNSNNK